MTTVDLATGPSGLQLSEEKATAALQHYQSLWNRAALSELLDGFSEDIVVEFADPPIIRGRAELEAVLRARMARQRNYRLEKQLRGVVKNTIIGTWTADWTDATTGTAMKGKGIEFIEIRDGKCVRWEATFNAWNAEGLRRSLFV